MEEARVFDDRIVRLKEEVVKEGIKSVRNILWGPERDGGVEGFELCLKLNSIEEFLDTLIKRHVESMKMLLAMENTWENSEVLGKYMCATNQVEYCYEVLKAATRCPRSKGWAIRRHNELMLKIYRSN